MFLSIHKIVIAIKERDPASSNTFWIVLLYPIIHVMFLYFISRFFWLNNMRPIARMIMQFARFLTGIEIHPGAIIGEGFFIDHGMGVVIGETAEIGNNVTIYHGVTLGGIMPAFKSIEQRGLKRHPTIENGVIIGSGAQVLGPIIVGENSRIGANSVVLKNVAKETSVVGIPAHEIKKENLNQKFEAYGTAISGMSKYDELLDNLEKQIDNLKDEIKEMQKKSK